MQTIQQTVARALTAAPAPLTPESPANTNWVERHDWQFDTCGEPKLAEMLLAAKQFAQAMLANQAPHWLSFLGSSGNGKTHLARALLRFWRTRAGWTLVPGAAGSFPSLADSCFKSWPAFLDRQRDGCYSELAALRDIPFVVFDDIGAEMDNSGFAKERLYRVAEARLGKWTVFTSNLLLEQIAAAIDPRVASRMIRGSSRVVQTLLPDYSLRKTAARRGCGGGQCGGATPLG